MNLSFELFKDIRKSGTVLKLRDMSGCIRNLKYMYHNKGVCYKPKMFEVNLMNKIELNYSLRLFVSICYLAISIDN